MIITNSRYTLIGYFITSYPTRAHGIIVIYLAGGQEKSSEKNKTKNVHKRPNEEGKVPQSKQKFCHHED